MMSMSSGGNAGIVEVGVEVIFGGDYSGAPALKRVG